MDRDKERVRSGTEIALSLARQNPATAALAARLVPLGALPAAARFPGTTIATHAPPEPTSIALLGTPLAALIAANQA